MTKQILCSNNEFDYRLKANGGKMDFGTPTMCLKKGYGLGFNQHIQDEAEFLKQWTGKYKPLVKQKLWCGDDATVPPGYDMHATLPQCLSKGYARGAINRAQQIRRTKGRISKRKQTTTPLPSRPDVYHPTTPKFPLRKN